MIIKIRDCDCTEVWDGVFYKKLSNYPEITDWEVRTLIEFIEYEKKYGRDCIIECENTDLLYQIKEKIADKEKYINTSRPKLLTECTACPYRKGCVTEYVCHTTSVDNAIKIFECGKLLSAIKARQTDVETLMKESRNAANDPADYFEYIMFAWGNCQAGDRLVMERELKRFPNEDDLSVNFNPGIRFYFKYDKLIKHPNAIFDGFLPLKVRDEVILSDWVYKIVIPLKLKDTLEKYIPDNLVDKIIYVENDCKDIWDWSEKVYGIIENSKMVIKPYEEKYRDDLIFMVLQAKDALGRKPAINNDLFDINANYFEKGTMFWLVLDDNDRVIGSVGYSKTEREDEAFIHRLFIKPTMKHKGIGTTLLKVVENEMKNKGIAVSLVHLGEPKEQWFESYSFYPKHGYQEYQPGYMKKIL